MAGSAKALGRRFAIGRAMLFDFVRGFTVLVSAYALSRLDTSFVYHEIRGERTFKLYVIFNILDIFDKLLTAVGQDVLDGLYRTTVSAAPPKSLRDLVGRASFPRLLLHVSFCSPCCCCRH